MVGGHDDGIAGLVAALAKGDAIMTTGPMVRVSLVDAAGNSKGLGELLQPVNNLVTLKVHVETADWYQVDKLEVLANVFMPDVLSGQPPRAIPLIDLTPVATARPNGGVAWVVSVDVPLDLDAAPFDGGDSWICVRVGGSTDLLYPLMFGGGGQIDATATTAADFFTNRSGPRPYAMTNPIFVDRDGDGSYR